MSREARRLILQSRLEEMLGSRNVYFQPPATIQMQYPCIVYEYERQIIRHANDLKYLKWDQYTVIIIAPYTLLEVMDAIEEEPFCAFDREYVSEGLYHYVYSIRVSANA